jgi:hypothetical protein
MQFIAHILMGSLRDDGQVDARIHVALVDGETAGDAMGQAESFALRQLDGMPVEWRDGVWEYHGLAALHVCEPPWSSDAALANERVTRIVTALALVVPDLQELRYLADHQPIDLTYEGAWCEDLIWEPPPVAPSVPQGGTGSGSARDSAGEP